MSDFWTWFSLLFANWQTWLSGGGFGGAVLIILYLVERLSRRTMNKLWYCLIFIVLYVLGASFMVWKDEHKQVISFQNIQAKEARNKMIREDLGKLIGEGFGIQDQCEKSFPEEKTHKAFVDWCDKANNYFNEKLDSSYHFLFEDTNKHIPTITIPLGMSPNNTRVWFFVESRKRNLGEFIKQHQ